MNTDTREWGTHTKRINYCKGGGPTNGTRFFEKILASTVAVETFPNLQNEQLGVVANSKKKIRAWGWVVLKLGPQEDLSWPKEKLELFFPTAVILISL